ncbi:uncharacterized protein DUF4348 [Tenacibaculum skagerrakense]|uniref:Uncharacterized protein DUF4348 n=1 Tax=Tenacibaculum skagerrakense TaxID=186571 RepID=A0A4R2P283_9FLAO|nr:DUF4348 domain-containing protein [Tenacibaculum skagerrakense]TCP27981.1 uncharacterized protein DUF4348 [Tenacibaculum skagerrakense]
MKYFLFSFLFICINSLFSQSETSTNCISDFDTFFKEFSKNEEFQKSTIKYPLKLTYISDLETNKIETKIYHNSKEWEFINFSQDQKAKNREYDQYTVSVETYDQKAFYKLKGIDNGILVIYQFEQIDDCWYLTLIKDESA